MQEFVTIVSLVGIRVLFTNGTRIREVSIPMLNHLLDEILNEKANKPSSDINKKSENDVDKKNSYREFLWESVKSACKVRDYNNRIHNILCEEGHPHIEKKRYLKRLENQFDKDFDSELIPFEEDLNGIVLSVEKNRIPKIVLAEEVRSGKIAYDEVELLKISQDLDKQFYENQRKAIENFNMYHSFQQIKNIDDPKEFSEARFKTMSSSESKMLDKVLLMDKLNGKKK